MKNSDCRIVTRWNAAKRKAAGFDAGPSGSLGCCACHVPNVLCASLNSRLYICRYPRSSSGAEGTEAAANDPTDAKLNRIGLTRKKFVNKTSSSLLSRRCRNWQGFSALISLGRFLIQCPTIAREIHRISKEMNGSPSGFVLPGGRKARSRSTATSTIDRPVNCAGRSKVKEKMTSGFTTDTLESFSPSTLICIPIGPDFNATAGPNPSTYSLFDGPRGPRSL